MVQTRCGRENCDEIANKFCLNCKVMLCRSHRVEDVRENWSSTTPEHMHIDAFDYSINPGYYQTYYCETHNQEMLTGRCINCGIFACNECIPEFCSKAAGKHHDFDSISAYVEKYKGELLEFEQLVRKKHETFLVKLKEACSSKKKIETDHQKMIDKVDEIVKRKVAALRYDGEALKEEIFTKQKILNELIDKQIKVIEQMELKRRGLLKRMQMCIHEASGMKLAQTYPKLKEDSEVLLQGRFQSSQLSTFELFSEGTELRRPLQLQLKEKAPRVEELFEEMLHTKEKKFEIKLLKAHEADDRAYHAVSYIPRDIKHITSENTVIAGGQNFTEKAQGEVRRDGKHHKSQVHQLLPYGNKILMLTQDSDTDTYRYTVVNLDSGDIVYSYADSSPFWNKRIAVTSTKQLLVLHVRTQTLHILSLETEGMMEKRLSDASMIGANGIMVPSDGKLIISCGGPAGHKLLKYNLETQQAFWESEALSNSRLNVTEYLGSLLVIKEDIPTDVLCLRLSDGHLVQKIECRGLPKHLLDVSIRGDMLVVAGWRKGICYFLIKDAQN